MQFLSALSTTGHMFVLMAPTCGENNDDDWAVLFDALSEGARKRKGERDKQTYRG